MKKLFRDVTLEQPFNCTVDGNTVQVVADESNTVQIGGETFIKLTDGEGHDIVNNDGNKVLFNEGVLYFVVNGVPESTNINITDVSTEDFLTFSVEPLFHQNQTILINGVERTSISAPEGTDITWSASADGYYSIDGVLKIVQNALGCSLLPVGSSAAWMRYQSGSEVYIYTRDNLDSLLVGKNAYNSASGDDVAGAITAIRRRSSDGTINQITVGNKEYTRYAPEDVTP